jgi:hypothetical protein
MGVSRECVFGAKCGNASPLGDIEIESMEVIQWPLGFVLIANEKLN